MKCKKCSHVGEPITSVGHFPGMSIQVDEEDPDYTEHQHGLDVDGDISIGLEVCRNCYAMAGFWIEDAGDAEFHSDWGKQRSTQQPAGPLELSDDEILAAIQVEQEDYTKVGWITRQRIRMGKSVLAAANAKRGAL